MIMQTYIDTTDPAEELRYKDEVSEKLVEMVHEYLQFATVRDLLKLITNNL